MSKTLLFSVTLADCEVQTFRAGGKGGQNQNKRDTGVRVIHHPSGARGECREERSQLQNKRKAFTRMAQSKEFVVWVRKETGKDALLQERVTASMKSENLKIEVKDNGKWVKEQL